MAAGVAELAGGVVIDDLVRHDPRRGQCRLRVHLDADVAPAAPETEAPATKERPKRRRSSSP
jgi:hypothetical protein